VTDFYGVPWENIIIKIKSKEEFFSSTNKDNQGFEKNTKTNSEGKYEFNNLPIDSFEITLLRSNSLTIEEKRVTGILSEEKTYHFDFGVEVGTISECQYFVTGIVKDSKGKVIEGAKISLINSFNQRRVQFALTDTNGFYKIDVCNLGTYLVFTNTPKYEVQTSTITFENHKDYQKRINFKLNRLPLTRINWRK
jgi:hypothetical protein